MAGCRRAALLAAIAATTAIAAAAAHPLARAPSPDRAWPPAPSNITGGSRDTVPGRAAWSRCRHCALAPDGRTVEHYGAAAAPPRGAPLARTKWHGFFRDGLGDDVHGAPAPAEPRGTEAERCAGGVVDSPTVLIDILTWQPGHLLVDVLEPLYATLRQHYGGRPPPGLNIVTDVAAPDERPVLATKIAASTGPGSDTVCVGVVSVPPQLSLRPPP